jgi:hypothetical protein
MKIGDWPGWRSGVDEAAEEIVLDTMGGALSMARCRFSPIQDVHRLCAMELQMRVSRWASLATVGRSEVKVMSGWRSSSHDNAGEEIEERRGPIIGYYRFGRTGPGVVHRSRAHTRDTHVTVDSRRMTAMLLWE